jgi:hypothetical protein
MVARSLCATLTSLLVVAGPATSPAVEPARAFLASTFELRNSDFGEIDAGRVYSRTMDVSDKREIATLGVVRIRMTPEYYVQRLSDIANFKRVEAVLQIGAFGNSPDLDDVADLTLDDTDIRSLRSCRIGNCGVQLSAEAIDRFRREVNWQRADAPAQANAVMRRVLVEYVTRYLKAGAAASMQYADQSEPLNLGHEFVALTSSELRGWQQFHSLRQHFIDYPTADAAGTTDFLYWSKEKVGRRTVVSITHVAIAHTAGGSPADYAIASKQIYGTHYYDASVGLTLLVRDHSSESPVTYLAYLNRSRIDLLNGMLGGITRRILSPRARSTVADQLARLQRTLEPQFIAWQVR